MKLEIYIYTYISIGLSKIKSYSYLSFLLPSPSGKLIIFSAFKPVSPLAVLISLYLSLPLLSLKTLSYSLSSQPLNCQSSELLVFILIELPLTFNTADNLLESITSLLLHESTFLECPFASEAPVDSGVSLLFFSIHS